MSPKQSLKPGRASLPQRVLSTAKSYLSETTVHGFRYLVVSKSALERLFWSAWLVAGFSGCYFMVSQSIAEYEANPILTTVDTGSIKAIPFPAVTVDAGDVIDPWGFVTKAFNQVKFECYDDPANCSNTSEIRDRVRFLIRAVVDRYNLGMDDFLAGHSIDDILALPKHSSLSLPLARRNKKDFLLAFHTLAAIKMNDPDVYRTAKNLLREKQIDTFATYSVRAYKYSRQFAKVILSEIESLRAEANVTDEDVELCKRGDEKCGDLKGALVEVLKPFMMNRMPYEKLGLGNFLSYFSWRVLSTQHGDTTPSNFLSRKFERRRRGETELAELTEDAINVVGNEEIGLNAFELANVASKQAWNYENKFLNSIFDCDYMIYRVRRLN